MTIHRDWLMMMKDLCPTAFTETIPMQPEVGFIDGQIKLMAMPRPPSGVPTWELFLRQQFVKPIERHWRDGASHVILAFDDYANVPKAKSITQATRRLHVTPLKFSPDDKMFDSPPEPWDAAMANRTFKAKVQELIIEALPQLITVPRAGCKLTVDWRGPDLMCWTWGVEDITYSSSPREQIGEADIKFARWVRALGLPMAVEATDGDFVPIALLGPPVELAILRYELGAGCGHRYEWVYINSVRDALRFQMKPYRGKDGKWNHCEIDCLVAMIALGGTDYTRGLPWVGPKKMWKMLPTLLPRVAGCFELAEDGVTRNLNSELGIDWCVAPIYSNVYAKHTQKGSFDTVMDGIMSSKLSTRTKDKMPSPKEIITTLKNCNFVIRYWKSAWGEHPTVNSMEGFGFRFGPEGLVEWDD